MGDGKEMGRRNGKGTEREKERGRGGREEKERSGKWKFTTKLLQLEVCINVSLVNGRSQILPTPTAPTLIEANA